MNSLYKTLSGISLFLFLHLAHAQTGVPTYNNIGLTWAGVGGPTVTCTTQYRIAGSTTWLPAQNLWWDDRPAAEWRGQEYRGSIVGLKAGTTYEIKLTLSSGTTSTISVTTKTEVANLPIGSTVAIPSGSSGYTISTGGTASGYRVYDGSGATISGGTSVGVTINADYVILKNLTITNVGPHGIEIASGRHHIIIDNCDISNWGTSCSGWQTEMNNGIYSGGSVHNITIQNCDIHHPRYDANSWEEEKCGGGGNHPLGARGIGLKNSTAGAQYQIVIRNNFIYSDDTRMFNDGMGNNSNFSYAGFPGDDSDIHGNSISHVWDDGLEMEGSNVNTRVYENKLDYVNIAFGLATTSAGPLYVFRNIAYRGKTYASRPFGTGWEMFKMGTSSTSKYIRGKIYLYHNTMRNPNGGEGFMSGIYPTGTDKIQYYVESRNNILYVTSGSSIRSDAATTMPGGTFDYDLYNDTIPAGHEANGVFGVPTFNGDKLASSSLGYDKGLVIANFNDQNSAWPMSGAGPDIGALEDIVATSGPHRIEAGSTASYTDGAGNVWAADHSYGSGGGVVDRGAIEIANTTDDRIYQTERWGLSSYAIAVANGTYTVRLHFAETYTGITAAGQRVFTVTAEGATPSGWANIDVFGETGGRNIALIKTATVSVTDGVLNLGFTASANKAMINGIEVIAQDTTAPSVPTGLAATNITSTSFTLSWTASSDNVGVTGYEVFTNGASSALPSTTSVNITGLSGGTTYNMNVRARDAAGNWSALSTTLSVTTAAADGSIRIESGGTSSFTDGAGNNWAADHSYGTGGGIVDRGPIAIANTTDDRIYQTERWGVSSYAIALSSGTYTVRLHFAETYTGITAAGQRVFTVTAEGATPTGWSNIDVFAQAGGRDIALIKTATVSVTDGTLNLGFTASANNTMISGIEIIPVVDKITSISGPSSVTKGTAYTVSVGYSAGDSRRVYVEFRNPSNSILASSYVSVAAGSGTANVTVTVPSSTASGTGYRWTSKLKGASGSPEYDRKDQTGVTVN